MASDKDSQNVAILAEWATSHGAMLHPSVEIYHDADTGLSFRVKSSAVSLAPWETVVSLPKSLTLSYLNAVPTAASAAPINQGVFQFHEDLLARTPPHVVGRLFLVIQYLLGRESFWWPYIQALPLPDNQDDEEGGWVLPPFWPLEDMELLEGTNVEIGLEKIRNDVRNEFSRVAELLQMYHPDLAKPVTARLYHWAYCIFSSRSFRPSIVLSEAEQGSLPAGVKIDDFSVLMPLFDIGNHDMTLDVRWEPSQQRQDQGGASRCELKVGKWFDPGQQVYNNYGMKTNAELLLGYGFMISPRDELHNDYIHVRKRTQTGAVDAASGEYYISARPMDHPSSLLGQHKQELKINLSAGRQMLGAFRHIQPEMAWDIFSMLSQGRLLLGGGEDDEIRQQRFFGGQMGGDGDDGREVLEQTVAVIQHKVLQELERLDETDVEVTGGEEEELSGRQRLALEYRRRCRLVLENTLEAMGSMEE